MKYEERDFGLSGREAEVARWLCAGKSNPEIATILGISPRTVEKHIEGVFRKLGVGSRYAAMTVLRPDRFGTENT